MWYLVEEEGEQERYKLNHDVSADVSLKENNMCLLLALPAERFRAYV